jgi:SAM-dependent methyltransferase
VRDALGSDRLCTQEDLSKIDAGIAQMSLGSGNPIALAELEPGETVLDLGSGAGLDCFLAARKVGAEGKVIGVDMTPDMMALARRNLENLRLENVEFREGRMESLPVPSASVDVVISNCVINLSPDKSVVLGEVFRVLRPGGRLRVSDIVWVRPRPEGDEVDLTSWTCCVAGALPADTFKALLDEAGFTEIGIEQDEPEEDRGWTNADISARKPADARPGP